MKPAMQLKEGVPVNDNQGLEREAKFMGQKAFTRGRIVQGIHADDASGTSGGATAIGNSSNAAPTQLQRNRRRWTLAQLDRSFHFPAEQPIDPTR